VDTKVEDVPGNKVKITVDIKEGKRAVIREINFVGDTKFPEKEIRQSLELKTPNWLSWYKQDDRYSRETLQSDLEKIRSYDMDRGYANFQIESTQVEIAPEKDDIFISVNVNEGEVYQVSEVKLAGTMVVPEAEVEEASDRSARPDLFEEDRDGHAGVAQLSVGLRGLLVCEDRTGTDHGSGEEDGFADLLHRSG
jgi:outer membrane protein assembly factor BamA